MNNNLVKFPIRFGTLLLAGAALVSCTKETFTEQQALDLEKKRLQAIRSIDSMSRVQARRDQQYFLQYQRAIDSLERLNAGGRVFYTVIPVDASTSIFTSNNGRAEKAQSLDKATVTVSQYGKTFTLGTGAGNGSTNGSSSSTNGVFTFADLRSGEVTVNIRNTDYTEVSYVANLTPDGGVANNGVVYVGNVIPMFFTGTDAAKNAVIRGRAYYEGDLTNDREEAVTSTVLGAGTVLASAQIDVTRANAAGVSYFNDRFLHEGNDENVNSFGTQVKSGRIQRIAYENVTKTSTLTSGQVDYNGTNVDVANYSMIVPASAVGLPIMVRFAEFAADRRFYRFEEGRTQIRTERYLYGPNVTPSNVPLGAVRPTLSFQAFETAAALTATFSPRTSVAGARLAASNSTTSTPGLYLSAPVVTRTAGAVSGYSYAVGTPVDLNAVAITGGTVAYYPANSFMSFNSVNLVGTQPAATAPEDLTIRRTDVFPNAGKYVVPATGVGSASGGSISRYIQILDGGFGFKSIPGAGVTSMNSNNDAGKFTGILPRVFFTKTENTSADASLPRDRGYNATSGGTFSAEASAQVLVDYNATYTVAGNGTRYVSAVNGLGGGVGAIQEIFVTDAGRGYPSAPFTSFSYGEDTEISGFDNNQHLFESNGTNQLRFNVNYPITNVGGAGSTISQTTLNLANGVGSSYTFVPNASLAINAAAQTVFTNAGGSAAQASATPNLFIVTVNTNPATNQFGKVTQVQLATNVALNGMGSLNFGAAGSNFMNATPFNTPGTSGSRIGIQISATKAGNTLRATQTTIGGSTLDGNSYTLNLPSSFSNVAGTQTFANWASANSTKIVSNTDLVQTGAHTLTTDQLLAGNSLLVIFDAPNAGPTSEYAWGVPVFETTRSSSGEAITGTLRGIRVLNPGRGYNTAANSSVNFHIVPNPWYSDVNPLDGAGGALAVNVPTIVNLRSSMSATSGDNTSRPSDLSTNITGATIRGDVNAIFGYLPASATASNMNSTNKPAIAFVNGANTYVTTSNNQSEVAIAGTATAFKYPLEAATINAATITFGGIPSGSGYVKAPKLLVFGGGLDLTPFNGTLTSPGGLLTFTTRLNDQGTVVGLQAYTTPTPAVGFTTAAPVSRNGNTTTQLVSRRTTAGEEHILTYSTAANPTYSLATGATNVNLIVRVIDETSEALTRDANRSVAEGGVGATVNVNAKGNVSSVTFGRGYNPKTNAADLNADAQDAMLGLSYANLFTQVEWSPNNSSAGPNNGNPSMVAGPKVYISAPTTTNGTNATASSFISVDPANDRYRRVTLVQVTNQGSGYGVGNRWQRLTTTTNNTNTGSGTLPQGNGGVINDGTDSTTPGQGAWVYGGSEGNGGLGNQYNVANYNNVRFDVFPAMTYTRDIHYGTGRELD